MAGAARKKAIAELEHTNPNLWKQYQSAKHGYEAINSYAREAGRFEPTASGKLNLYSLFAEAISQLTSVHGQAGIIIPTGISTDDSNKAFFDEMASGGRIASLYDFENREKLFAAVDSRMKFCALTLGRQEAARFVFFATRTDHLRDERRAFRLTGADIVLLNPNTRTCPVFRSQADAELTKKIYRRVPVLIDERKGAAGNPWGITFRQGLFNMTSDSGLFRTAAQMLEAGAEREGPNWRDADGALWVPLFEAKMVHQFDHRWATYGASGEGLGARSEGLGARSEGLGASREGRAARGEVESRDVTSAEKADPAFTATPRYWIKLVNVDDALAGRSDRQWLMGWRDITNATNERTVIAGVVPRLGVGNKLPLMFPDASQSAAQIAALYGNLAALCFDFVARQKIGGTTLNYFYAKQFPVLPPGTYGSSDLTFIIPRVLELTYTAHDLRPWFEEVWNSLGDTPEGEATRDRIRAAWAESHGQPVTPGPSHLATHPTRPLPLATPPTSSSPLAPFPCSPDRRARLRAELDAYYARLYGLTRDELRYILDPADVYGPDYPSETFRVLKNNEIRKYGEYRTQRLVLEAWDGLSGTQ